jgi:hypothetical protein
MEVLSLVLRRVGPARPGFKHFTPQSYTAWQDAGKSDAIWLESTFASCENGGIPDERRTASWNSADGHIIENTQVLHPAQPYFLCYKFDTVNDAQVVLTIRQVLPDGGVLFTGSISLRNVVWYSIVRSTLDTRPRINDRSAYIPDDEMELYHHLSSYLLDQYLDFEDQLCPETSRDAVYL